MMYSLKKKVDGFWPVMLTPFDAENRIDWPAYERMIDFYIDSGAAGLFATCGSSEVLTLTPDEIVELSRRAVLHAGGRVPVVSGAICVAPPDQQIDLFKRVAATRPFAVVLSSSQLAEEDDDESIALERLQAFMAVDDQVNLGIYEYPSPYKRLLSADALKQLADTGRFVFFKDTSCNIDQIRAKIAAVKGSRIAFFNANTQTLAQSLDEGADGFSGIGGNFIPELYSWLCSNHDLFPEQADKVQGFMNDIDPAICLGYPVSAKVAMKLNGAEMQSFSRVSDARLNENDVCRLNDVLTRADKLKNSLN